MKTVDYEPNYSPLFHCDCSLGNNHRGFCVAIHTSSPSSGLLSVAKATNLGESFDPPSYFFYKFIFILFLSSAYFFPFELFSFMQFFLVFFFIAKNICIVNYTNFNALRQ